MRAGGAARRGAGACAGDRHAIMAVSNLAFTDRSRKMLLVRPDPPRPHTHTRTDPVCAPPRPQSPAHQSLDPKRAIRAIRVTRPELLGSVLVAHGSLNRSACADCRTGVAAGRPVVRRRCRRARPSSDVCVPQCARAQETGAEDVLRKCAARLAVAEPINRPSTLSPRLSSLFPCPAQVKISE